MKNLELLQNTSPSALQRLEIEPFAKTGIALYVKRDDLLHPHVSGNKWRKLKYNLLEAHRQGVTRLVTFGGAFSNHLAAVAAAGETFGLETLGVVRGREGVAPNPTLRFAEACGMRLEYVSRTDFGQKTKEQLLHDLGIDLSQTMVLPEGGANCLALQGCQEIITETTAQLGKPPDYYLTACGTGATLAGMAAGLGTPSRALGVAVLRGGFLSKEVQALLNACGAEASQNWQVLDGFHFGGYAKWTMALVDFINAFMHEHGIALDPIYTGKAMFALHELARQGYFQPGATIVFVHTGGLQGIAGFNERFGDLVGR